MASGDPGTIAGVSPVITTLPQSGNNAAAAAASANGGAGKIPPQSGKPAPASAAPVPTGGTAAAVSNDAKSATASQTDPQSLVDQVNKYLNDSGRPDQFRVDPDSASYIQQVNPSTGTVVAKYLASEFPALARSVGASGLLIDDTA